MFHSCSQHRPYIFIGRLLTGLLLVAWLAPAARGEGWPYWPFKKDDKPGKPDKIITLWSDTVLTQAGRPPIRGFGGRLMFYEGKKEDPVKVEGTLVVYAFDETDRDANNSRPDRKYVFMPQQLPAHYSKSKIGHSYSVWLPWDEVGGMQKDITLIVRFEPKDAPVAISDPCRQLLPGRIATAQAQLPAGGAFAPGAMPNMVGQAGPVPPVAGNWGNVMAGSPMTNGGVQPAAYQAPVTDGAAAPWQQRHITTATIDVPSGSVIRSAITSPAGPGYFPAAPGPAGPTPAAGQNYAAQNYGWPNYPSQSHATQNYPAQNYATQNYPTQNYPAQNFPSRNFAPGNYSPAGSAAPATSQPATPPVASPGLQLRSGFAPGRQWPLGEPLARLSRDRAPSPPHPAESPYGPGFPPGQPTANAAPAAPAGVPQSPN